MKRFSNILHVLIFSILFFGLGGLVMAQDDVPTVPVVEASPFDWQTLAIVGWTGFVGSTALALYMAMRLASMGDKQASLGLQFFEAAKTMIPLDQVQSQFDIYANRSPALWDDIIARFSRTTLEKAGLITPETTTTTTTTTLKE